MRFSILVLASAATLSVGLASPANQIPMIKAKGELKGVRKALRKAEIINEVLDDFKPRCSVIPFYGQNVTDSPVTLGNTFEQSETKNAPGLSFKCSGVKGDTGFVVALTDPDATSRDDPKWSEMCHWILTIPSFNVTELSDLEINTTEDSRTEDLVKYKSPGPPPKTGYHRYVFVVLAGDVSDLTAPEERQHWGTGKVRHGVRDWAEKEGLKVVGANYFVEQNEEQ